MPAPQLVQLADLWAAHSSSVPLATSNPYTWGGHQKTNATFITGKSLTTVLPLCPIPALPRQQGQPACVWHCRKAKEEGWRARSAFKLLQIDDAFQIFEGALGASWSLDFWEQPSRTSLCTHLHLHMPIIFLVHVKNVSRSH